MLMLIRVLMRPWFYVAAVLVSVFVLDPAKLRSPVLFYITLGYIGIIWIIMTFGKKRLYECSNTSTVFGLLTLAPPFFMFSGAYVTGFMVAYLLVLASYIFPTPQINAHRVIMQDTQNLNRKR